MWLEVGDIQFCHNHQILHARGEFQDSPAHIRHLLRLWLYVEKEKAWERPPPDQISMEVYNFDVPHTVPLEAE